MNDNALLILLIPFLAFLVGYGITRFFDEDRAARRDSRRRNRQQKKRRESTWK